MLIYVSEAESTKNTNKKLPKKMKRITLKQKRSWIRIVEAFIAVMIVMSVVLVVISRQPQFEPTTEEELVKTQRHILDQVKETPDLRTEVLARGDLSNVNAIVAKLIPEGYSYETRVCDLETICSLGLPVEGDIFVEEVVISADLTTYKPTLLKLFFWEGEYPEDYQPVCGNGACESGETEENCPADCKVEPPEPVCNNDGTCDSGETTENCPGDCPAEPTLEASYTTPTENQGTNPGCTATENWYYYDLTITETSGTGSLTLESRKRCYETNEPRFYCDSLRTTMPGGLGENVVIYAGSSITMNNRWFCLGRGYAYNVTETFYSDNSGTNSIIEYLMTIDLT